MNKKIILILCILLIFNNDLIVTGENKDSVTRHILLDINWNSKQSYVEALYVSVRKVEGQNFVVKKRNFILDGALDPNKNWSREEMINELKNNHYSAIYISDEVFGYSVEIFADLSDRRRSQQEINRYVEEAKESIKEDFSNKDEVIKKLKEESQNNTSISKIAFWILGIFFVFLIVTKRL